MIVSSKGHQLRRRPSLYLTVACLSLMSLSCSGKQGGNEQSSNEVVNLAERDQLRSFIVDRRSTFANMDAKVGELKEWATRRVNDPSWLFPNAKEEMRVMRESSVERDVADNISHQLAILAQEVNELRLTDPLSKDVSEQFSRELSDRSHLMADIQRGLQATIDEITNHPGRIPGNLLSVASAGGYSPLGPLSEQLIEKLKHP